MDLYRAAVIAALLAFAAPVQAVLHFTGYDADDGAGDTLEVTEVPGSGAEDTDLQLTTNAAEIHNKLNGGGDSSKKARKLTIETNGEQTWDEVTVDSTPELTVGFTLYVITQPNVNARQFFAMREADASDGCQLLLTPGSGASGRAVQLAYNGGASLGASIEKFQTSTCCATTTSTTDDCLYRTECTSGASCPTNAPNCVCNATTGKGCYHGAVEVHQKTVSSTQVQCDVVIDGRLTIATGLFVTTDAAPLVGFRYGAIDTVARQMTMVFDDLTWESGVSRVYPGYVEMSVVSQDGATLQWATSSGASHFALIDDYLTGGTYDEPSRITTSSSNKRDDFARMTPAPAHRGDESIQSAETVLLGTTSGSGSSREFDFRHRTCSGTCADGTATRFTLAQNTNSHVWGRFPQELAPTALGNVRWTEGNAALASWAINTTAASQNLSRISAAATYWRIKQPDEPLPITLSDHNRFADDGIITKYQRGDSTNTATATGECPAGPDAGQPCTFQSHCDWDDESVGGTEDHPVGGCNFDNVACITCTTRDVANGIWYPCESDTDCTGTCSCSTAGCGGTCSPNTAVPCDSNDDCNKGTCDTDAVCIDSCTDDGETQVDCPTGAAWGNYVGDTLGANVIVNIGVGLQSSSGFLNNVPSLIDGIAHGGEIVRGDPVPCGCSVSHDCGACSNSPTTPCDSDDDCGVGATCSTGTCGTDGYGRSVCTVGPRIAVTAASQCQYAGTFIGGPIVTTPPDSMSTLIGYNDTMQPGAPPGHAGIQNLPDAPECEGLWSVQHHWPNGLCDTGTPTLCTQDSDCSGISADSTCVGFGANGSTSTDTDYPCYQTTSGGVPSGGTCTMRSAPCTTSADCGGTGITSPSCVNGECVPGTCPTGYTTRNGKCWKTCSDNSGCGGVTDSCVSATSCKGVCTHPSNSVACQTPSDCVRDVQLTSIAGVSGKFGTIRAVDCVSNTCRCTGLGTCPTAACPNTPLDFYAMTDHTLALRNFKAAQDYVDGLAETDGRPLLIWHTPPETIPRRCTTTRGAGVDYFPKLRTHMLLELPHVVDSLRLIRDTGRVGVSNQAKCLTCPIGATHGDNVHHTAFTGSIIGAADSNYASSLGTCAVQDATSGMWGPQKYCRNTSRTWSTTTCTTSAGCSATQFCEPRRCECVCRTSPECVNWYGPGHECVEANDNACDPGDTACWCQRASDNVDSCDVVFDTGSQAWTCNTTSKVCEASGQDVCPASGDTCRVE
jgi:hypothetical protein